MKQKSIYIIIIFIVTIIAQLFVPAKMILDKEDVLNHGKVYKFKTKPIDPNDPFRGKYVVLSYDLDSYKTKELDWERGDEVFVYLGKDSLGYATISSVIKTLKKIDTDYVVAKVNWYSLSKNILYFDFEFDRYYMDEFKAKPAEDAYREFNRRIDTIDLTYSKVAIKNGNAVLKDVFINDIPLKIFVEKERLQN